MMVNGSLGDRMKMYESVYERRMLAGVPHIVRLDMVAGHTFTRNMDKPYDELFHDCMRTAVIELLEQCPNARMAYAQSDEITLVLNDSTANGNYAPFYSNRVSKIESILSARCTNAFVSRYMAVKDAGYPVASRVAFDARVFDVPDVIEAYNCLLWRAKDAERNAWQALGHAMFPQNELNGRSNAMVKEMLEAKGVDFSMFPDDYWKGTLYVKDSANSIIESHDVDYETVNTAYHHGHSMNDDEMRVLVHGMTACDMLPATVLGTEWWQPSFPGM